MFGQSGTRSYAKHVPPTGLKTQRLPSERPPAAKRTWGPTPGPPAAEDTSPARPLGSRARDGGRKSPRGRGETEGGSLTSSSGGHVGTRHPRKEVTDCLCLVKSSTVLAYGGASERSQGTFTSLQSKHAPQRTVPGQLSYPHTDSAIPWNKYILKRNRYLHKNENRSHTNG